MGNNFTLDSFLDLINPARTLPKDVEDEHSTNIALPPSDTMGINLDNPVMPEQIQQMPVQKLSSEQPSVNSDMLKNITSTAPARTPAAIEPKIAKPESGYSKPVTPKERVGMDLGLKAQNIDAPAFNQSQYGEDLSDAALKRAQGDTEANRRNAMLMLAGNQMNEAFSGAKVDNRAIDEFLKTANTGEKNIESRRAGKDQEMSRALKGYEMATAKEQSDPGSEISRSYRELYSKYTGKAVGKEVSARQLKEALAIAEKGYFADQSARDKAEARADKKDEKAKLSDKQLAVVAGYDKAIKNLDDIIMDKGDFDTGPVAGRFNTMAGWVGMDDAKKTAFRTQVGDQLAEYIKSISGAAVSDRERAVLMQNRPNMNDNDKTFMEKAKNLKEKLVGYRKLELELMSKQGKTVAQYSDDKSDRTPGSKNDTRIDAFMKANNIKDRNEAIKILKDNGKL